IPGVLSVAQGLPGSSTRFLYDCSTPCNPKEAGSGDCDPVAAGAQPTDCFCINPGEGFEVQTSGSITLQVTGYDNLVPLSTPALPNGNYISLPYHRPPTLVTAADAHTAIGSTAGSAQLSRFNACTSTVQSHIAGSASPFPLAGPCEAYAFSDPVAHTYANPVGSGPSGLPTCVSQAAHLYCISGTSTNVGYSWLLDFSPPGAGGGDIGPVSAPAVPPVGAPASALAAAFIQSISAAGGTAIAAGGDCFQVSGSGAFTLYVGPVGSSPTCAVGPGGCSYNPLITLGMPEQAAPEMPASGPAGLVILAITLMGISIAMLSRKRRD
ncbi:MAG TPA: hypothetical protein VFG76_10505, partial [Candidatus Polarisedimenticolia bacterium]|nr:hypothetical protein [Candidatus Polarisedimenticolia bacterium]